MIFLSYIFCIAVAVLNKKSTTALYFSIFPLIVSTGLRKNVGRDYPVYEDIFQGQTPVSGIDPVFLYCAHVLANIDPTGRLGFMVASIIIIIGFTKFIDRFSLDKGISMSMFLSVPIYYISSLNTLRFYLGLSICLFLISMVRKQFLMKLFLAAVSGSMHLSTILLIPILWLRNFVSKYSIFVWSSLFIVPLISFILITRENDIIPSALRFYALNDTSDSKFLIFSYSVMGFFISIFNYINKRNIENGFLFIVTNLHVLFCVVWLFSSFGNLFLRISNLFSFAPIITIPIFLHYFIYNSYLREFIRFWFIILLCGYFSFKYSVDPSFGFIESYR